MSISTIFQLSHVMAKALVSLPSHCSNQVAHGISNSQQELSFLAYEINTQM